MDAFPPCLSLGWIVFGYLCSAASGGEVYQKNITAECGQNITLTCRVPNNNVIVVEWSRADLKEEEYVFIYRDGHLYADGQHPSFKNRVDLQDRQMKDGDVSLILKNVTINDAGTYLCRILMKGTNRKNTKPTSTINLSVVDPPGQPGGHTEDGGKEDGVTRGHPGLVAGLSVFSVICVVVAVFVIIGKLKTSNSS